MTILQRITPSWLPAGRAALALPGSEPRRAADPDFDIRMGMGLLILFFVLFLGWTAVAPLDAAAIATGRLVVSGERQSVQHPTGGVVASIHVREGAKVRRGDILISLSAAEARGQERALAGQAISLLAQRARLQAEEAGSPTIIPPPEFARLKGQDRIDADRALSIQETQIRTRSAVLSTQQRVLGEQASQATSQGRGYSQRAGTIQEQIGLLSEELAGLRGLAEKGFVPKTRIRALERARADLQGQLAQDRATADASRSQVGQSRLEILQAKISYQERVASEIRDVNNSLADVLPKWEAARDQLNRADIRAPATGTVVGLTVFTPGGVIGAGEKLMDIIPDRMPLTIEARVSPNDADDLEAGQRAFVRFYTLHERSLPALEGSVTRVSADAFTEQRTGESYYTASVQVPLSELHKIEELRGPGALKAGIPVSIEIPLRKRTALQYAFEPLMGAIERSFKEH
ncbi:HlyD family type I secretion periplasmic adaptor subunit [Sphingobium sp. TB-6]|uniref:HlyD family type I secretion periplasmic adaptor subunit n=1 Tax=Sphingobium sp. TB-6 TaxID=2728850 RepID=UPI00146CB347|nr:HlyD family type I secretion periplasmic adaptor subunit [Sphingobium sp. TB-6]NML90833.1 HlyD family type I secretion periplasmic adaptor subunit [Sphingobium sp. TB-6]